MKKKFSETKIGMILTSPLVKSLIKAVPFGIGSFAGSVLDDNTTASGDIDRVEVYPQLFKIGIYAVLIYFALKGSISFEDAEAAKGLLN